MSASPATDKAQGDDNDAGKRNAARVRDNQRRARERHKAYVEDLRRRVKDYEGRSTLATLEMQQAARAVAAENTGLRLLLRQRGVGDAEVDQFLQSLAATAAGGGRFEGRCPAVAGREVRKQPGRPSSANTTTTTTATTTGQLMSVSSEDTRSLTPLASADTPHRLAVLADATVQQQDCCGGRTQCTLTNDGVGPENSNEHTPSTSIDTTMLAASPEPPSASHSLPQRRSPTTMSCTEAAEIVAKMHGHGDSDLAKAALGCGNQPECMVKNTAMFQILEGGGDGV